MMTTPTVPPHEHNNSVGIGSHFVYLTCQTCGAQKMIAMAAAVDFLNNGLAYKEAATQGARYITDFVSMDARGRMAAFDRLCDAVAVLPEDVRYQP